MPTTISDFATNVINPSGLTVDTGGNLYVAARGQNSVLKIAKTTTTGLGGTPSVIAGGQEPTGVAVDSSGNVFT